MAEKRKSLRKINPCYPYAAPKRVKEIPVEVFLARRSTINGVGEGDGEELPDITGNISDALKLQRKLNGSGW